jgi:hypothetical protein
MSVVETAVAGGPGPFAALNRLVVPAVRAGLGAPLPLPAPPAALWSLGWVPGLVILEVPGRRSGRRYRVPLTAVVRGRSVVLSTVRARSQWLRNLAAAEEVGIWLRGRRRTGTPWVRGAASAGAEPSAALARALAVLGPLVDAAGLQLAEVVLDAAPARDPVGPDGAAVVKS